MTYTSSFRLLIRLTVVCSRIIRRIDSRARSGNLWVSRIVQKSRNHIKKIFQTLNVAGLRKLRQLSDNGRTRLTVREENLACKLPRLRPFLRWRQSPTLEEVVGSLVKAIKRANIEVVGRVSNHTSADTGVQRPLISQTLVMQTLIVVKS